MLALLADLLHDGITPRPALGELLDNLAQSAREGGVTDEMSLRAHLFTGLRFAGNEDGYHDPRNSDLVWSIQSRRSNPIGLCLVYILVGHRLGYRVEGVGYPGHFLCRIYPQGVPVLVDCFGNGQVHLQATLLEPESDLTRQQRAELRKTATPVGTLVRVLNNLAAAFEAAERQEDFQFVQRLRAMIED
jgi:regulator of sirC expression with transglutaminase-like and TPR domain